MYRTGKNPGTCQSANRYFFIQKSTGTTAGRQRIVKSSIGELSLTANQAQKLGVKPRTQISEYLEKCYFLVSANNSYERTEEDITMLLGVRISHSTQQRLVHRHNFEAVILDQTVETIYIDGGKVKLRTPKGEESIWNDYKAVTFAGQAINAYFHQNAPLVTWVNRQPLAPRLSCLGDGHDGIWNLFAQIGLPQQHREVLDWFHLIENRHKLELGVMRLSQITALLWQGQVAVVIPLLQQMLGENAQNFIVYLTKHQARIPNYQFDQQQGLTIGSGAVESAVKQIGRRLKISGAVWERQNVAQVLRHRCAYLNGDFTRQPRPLTVTAS
jgi:hypothetical protein